jgi:hypothetical protein
LYGNLWRKQLANTKIVKKKSAAKAEKLLIEISKPKSGEQKLRLDI